MKLLLLALVAAAAGLASAEIVIQNTCSIAVAHDGPEDWSCNNAASGETQALEIQNTLTSMISAASGDKIMTLDEFESYTSPVGIYSLNTPRNLQFAENCFFKSPNQPLNCTYDANVTALEPCILNNAIKELNDTTWGELAENVCAIYYPSLSTNVTLGPPAPGQMLVGPISKCQSMTFTAGDQWFLTDEWGNDYIMHASGANTTDAVDDAVASAVFPEGWYPTKQALEANFTINPRQDDNGDCYYTVVRDSGDNSYHQISCTSGVPQAPDYNAACPALTQSDVADEADAAPVAPAPSKPSKPAEAPAPAPAPASGAAAHGAAAAVAAGALAAALL